MVPLLASLAGTGIDFLVDMVKDKGEKVVTEVVKQTTGIDIGKNTTLTKEQIQKIKEFENDITKVILEDKQNSREMDVERQKVAKDWLVRNTGSIIALMIVVGVFVLFVLLLNGKLQIDNPNVAMILGFAGGYVTQVLSFYFGSSKTEADSKRENQI